MVEGGQGGSRGVTEGRGRLRRVVGDHGES